MVVVVTVMILVVTMMVDKYVEQEEGPICQDEYVDCGAQFCINFPILGLTFGKTW